jgi:hypothetical protein
MPSVDVSSDVAFSGSNWEDLVRLVTLARLHFLQNDEDYETEQKRCAYLASRFVGAALDWVGSLGDPATGALSNFEGFVTAARNQFGVSDQGLSAQRRGQLEALAWQHDLPVFFAEFDRLTHLCNLTGDAVKIALVRNKLPLHVQRLLAEQALDFANYDTMRERLLTMWSLDPSRRIANSEPGTATPGSKKRRSRCGRCGKKGHAASDCRASKN